MFAFADGAAFHEQSQAREPGHRDGILIAVGAPVAVLELLFDQVLQAFVHSRTVLFGDFIPKDVPRAEPRESQ